MVTAASARIYSKLRMHERHIDWKCAYCEFRNVPHPRTILFFMWHHDDGGKGNAHRITIFQKISLFLSARCGGHVHTLVSFLHFVDDLLPLMCVFFSAAACRTELQFDIKIFFSSFHSPSLLQHRHKGFFVELKIFLNRRLKYLFISVLRKFMTNLCFYCDFKRIGYKFLLRVDDCDFF